MKGIMKASLVVEVAEKAADYWSAKWQDRRRAWIETLVGKRYGFLNRRVVDLPLAIKCFEDNDVFPEYPFHGNSGHDFYEHSEWSICHNVLNLLKEGDVKVVILSEDEIESLKPGFPGFHEEDD
jgi:hypothetical protein